MTIAPETIVARDEDLQAVRQAVVDYCEGYYRRDPEQTKRAYHSECIKRSFASTDDDVWYLEVQTPASMVDVARVDRMRVDDPSYEIIIDDLSESIASVRLYSDGKLTIQKLGEKEKEHAYIHNNIGFAGDCCYIFQRDFIDHFISGKPFETNGENYLKTLYVQESVYESAKANLPITL